MNATSRKLTALTAALALCGLGLVGCETSTARHAEEEEPAQVYGVERDVDIYGNERDVTLEQQRQTQLRTQDQPWQDLSQQPMQSGQATIDEQQQFGWATEEYEEFGEEAAEAPADQDLYGVERGISAGPMSDQEFLRSAWIHNTLQVQLADKALVKSQNEQVKELAQEAKDEHQKALDGLKELAKDKEFTLLEVLPSEELVEVQKFDLLQGAEFDRQYLQTEIQKHEEAITEAQQAQATLKDEEVKQWAQKQAEEMEEHLQQARTVQSTLPGAEAQLGEPGDQLMGIERTVPAQPLTQGEFVEAAWQGNQVTVQMAEAALPKASNDQVKQFAQTLIDHHKKANEQLRDVALKLNATLPTQLSQTLQTEVQQLSQYAGGDFDRHFLGLMIADHEKEIAYYNRAVESLQDQQLKDYATATLPTLKAHLQKAKDLQGPAPQLPEQEPVGSEKEIETPAQQ